jgi:hypothetical protein
MKILPQPDVPGATPAERLDNAFRQVLTVPKSALLKAEEQEKIEREKKRAAKKPR